MHLADPIFIFILALVLLGPKRAGELAQQLAKLMGEFRKASNDFKYQFNEEMRVSEQQEQQRKQEAASIAPPAAENQILPPAGAAEAVPYAVSAVSATTGAEHSIEDHPLLRVDVIPPMEGSPADQTSTTAVTPANGSHPAGTSTADLEAAQEREEAPLRRG